MRRIIGVVILGDFTTKAAAVAAGVALRNDAYAFGVVAGAWWVLAGVSFAGLSVAVRVLRTRVDDVGLALIVGGAAANLIDRVATGAVHDFIPSGPIVFNLADVALALGIALAVIKRCVSGASDPASGMATTPPH